MSSKVYLRSFEAVKVSVAPIVVASSVSVKGQPEIACATSHFYGYKSSPTAKSAVIIVELRVCHSVLVIYSVIGSLVKIVSAEEKELASDFDERTARLCAFKSLADTMVVTEESLMILNIRK